MDAMEVEECPFLADDAKLHAGMCRAFHPVVSKLLAIFPFIEASRPRSKSGIQALRSLHVALDKSKGLLQLCADCSRLYLAITAETVVLKFEKSRSQLQESLRRVESIVTEDIGHKIVEIIGELEEVVFTLDQSEKEAGDEVINLLQRNSKMNSSSDSGELEVFHMAALKLGITSSRAALTERRALKKLIEKARSGDDKRKEFVVSYLYNLMRKYSKFFRSETGDDTDSQGSTPCSPTVTVTLPKNTRMEQNILEQILEGRIEPTNLSLETLREITDGFSKNRIIGQGGFGTVYKGIVGNRNIAVKRIRSSMTIDDKIFRHEVNSLMEVNHKNVVQFLGLCSHTIEIPTKIPGSRRYIYVEERERLLCFEYISNGTLDKKITDELRGLEWDKRYEIIKGICTGLHYLHKDKGILHMYLKPANILLDNDMLPKITDFGLSRLTESSQTTSTNIFVSYGYSAPEIFSGCRSMSAMSDMYSLGIIIIELVTGQKGIPDNIDNVLRRWRHRWSKLEKEKSLKYHEQVTKCIEIGSLCQKVYPCARPSILEVMRKFVELESMDNCGTISHESTVEQIKPSYWEDDMLGVEPLELQFANSGNDNQLLLSCSVELSNDTDSSIAVEIHTTSPLPYSIEPNKDIVQPRSKCSVYITLHVANAQAHNNNKYNKQFIVRSTKVNLGLTTDDMNEEVFDQHMTGHHVDEIYLSVFSEEPCNKEVTDSPTKQAKEYPSSEARPTPIKPGSVQLVIKNNKVAPLLKYNKKVMLELTGGDYTSGRRGLDLVAVVDVSWSMQGEKIEQLKTALRFLVRKLSPMDRLCVITFTYYAKEFWPLRQITEASQQELQDLISVPGLRTLFPGTSADIAAGLRAGLNVLAKREVHVGRVAGIMLVSAGQQAFDDVTSVDVGDVPVYTFCVAGTDSSVPMALHQVAANSMGGTFTHDTGGLTMAFSRCLADLLNVAIQNLELSVAAVRGESKIVKVTAGSYPQQRDGNGPAGSVTVSFGNLYGAEVRKVIVELLLPTIYRDRSAEILDVTYSHNCSAGGIKFVAPTETLTVWRTGVEFSEEEKHSNSLLRTELQELVELFKTQETYEKQAMKFLNQPTMPLPSENVASREEEMRRLALDVVRLPRSYGAYFGGPFANQQQIPYDKCHCTIS